MNFVYTPKGSDKPRRWEFDADELLSPEAEEIERRTGMDWDDWKSAVARGSIRALHGLLFVFLKRDNPALKWEQVQFRKSEVDFEAADDEVVEWIKNLEANEDDLDEEQQKLLKALRASVDVPAAEDTVAGEVAGEIEGKAEQPRRRPKAV